MGVTCGRSLLLTEVAEGSDQKSDWMGHCRQDGEFIHKITAVLLGH